MTDPILSFRSDTDKVNELYRYLNAPIVQEAIALLKETNCNRQPRGLQAHEALIQAGESIGFAQFPRDLMAMTERYEPPNTDLPATYEPEPDQIDSDE